MPDSVRVRAVQRDDRDEWLRMRTAFWSGSVDDHRDDIERFLAKKPRDEAVFVAERTGGALGGFVEVGLRAFAEGCDSSPIPFVEGWWVDLDLRGQHAGRLLMCAAERWAREAGYSEIASDTTLANAVSQHAHRALGFIETERIVCYRKQL